VDNLASAAVYIWTVVGWISLRQMNYAAAEAVEESDTKDINYTERRRAKETLWEGLGWGKPH